MQKKKSTLLTGVGLLVAAGAVALGGVSMANAATGTVSVAQSPTPLATTAATASTAPSTVSAKPSEAPVSSDAPLVYTALSQAESSAIWDAAAKEASALTPDQRSAKLAELLSQWKAQPSTGPSDAAAEKLSIAIKAYATSE